MHRCWVGVDGTRKGWVAVAILEGGSNFELWHVNKLSELELLLHHLNILSIAIDIPIGLVGNAQRGGRGCDREARKLLSLAKRNADTKKGLALVGPSSIFTPPSRRAMEAFCEGASHSEVSEINRQSANIVKETSNNVGVGLGLSIQTYHILPKIHEADTFISASTQDAGQSLSTKVPTFECHPELAFLALSDRISTKTDNRNNRLSLDNIKALWSKKLLEGRRQRIDLLCKEGGLKAAKLFALSQSDMSQTISDDAAMIESISQIRTWRIKSLADDEHALISVAADDVLDAMICAISSRKWSLGQAKVIEEGDGRCCDNRGLPMMIWA